MPKTKIICTLGPASANETVIRKMFLAGMDVARLNFSHGTHQTLLNKIEIIRLLNKKYRRRVKILGDLQGRRIRVGELVETLELKKNNIFYLTQEKIKGGPKSIPFDYKGALRTIKNGQNIFIDDGNILLRVIGKTKHSLKAKVIVGGILKQHKGINIPDAKLDFGGINKKDIEDIRFCEKHGVEYIAQSFARTAADIMEVKKLLKPNSKCKLIAKIENREGIKNLNEIVKVCDGIMIARGDMGVSLPIYEIPVVQKTIIKKCNKAKKFVITATQMLESMSENIRPTRAEVTDVANAIIDGTDFVMLSGESAVGKYPVETVKMMNDIIKHTEKYLKH
jgi:pyruvate kinase